MRINQKQKLTKKTTVSKNSDTTKPTTKKINNITTTKRNYFTIETQRAILNYNKSNNENIRNELYMKFIKNAFEEIVRQLIHKGGYDKVPNINLAELKSDSIHYLLEQMHLYREEKGKAFSYFTYICRNFLMTCSKERYKKIITETEIEYVDYNRNIINERDKEIVDSTISIFMDAFVNHIDTNIDYYFDRKEDHAIVYAILTILTNRIKLEDFNKKALYIMIREMTNAKTIGITKIVKIVKHYYCILYKFYQTHDFIKRLDSEHIISNLPLPRGGSNLVPEENEYIENDN
jgi:hypothetical protein